MEAVWVTVEVFKAVEMGYKILSVGLSIKRWKSICYFC